MRKPTLPAVAAIAAGPFVLGVLAGAAVELAGRGARSPRQASATARPAISVTLPDAAVLPAALEIELATLPRLR